MRKKEYCPWLPVVRLSHSSHVCIEPMFFARSKNLAGMFPQGSY